MNLRADHRAGCPRERHKPDLHITSMAQSCVGDSTIMNTLQQTNKVGCCQMLLHHRTRATVRSRRRSARRPRDLARDSPCHGRCSCASSSERVHLMTRHSFQTHFQTQKQHDVTAVVFHPTEPARAASPNETEHPASNSRHCSTTLAGRARLRTTNP